MYPSGMINPLNLDIDGSMCHHSRKVDGNIIDTVYNADGNLV